MDATTVAFQESRLTVHGAVAEFSHQRPQARNPISMALRDDYDRMLRIVAADRSLRALIITGSGGSFCAGGDVKDMADRLHDSDPARNSPEATRRRLGDIHRWLTPLHEIDIPVIAAVDGAAMGAGFALALQADFVLASTRARFGMSFARIGAVPDMGALHALPRIVGLARAKELMITGRRVDAAEAKALGIVLEVHAPEALADAAHAFARRLAAAPREATAMTRKLLNRSFETDYLTMAELETYAQAIAMATPYHAEAAARIARGEPPPFDWDRERNLNPPR
ncbi:MAG: enoyl-CoA hydratase/isomerase family protein [Proteobacteria bacterium]|nr:enoyl-CoA hydratase/isomerase family protein [Pseudomonadota bacterium]